MNWLDLAVLIVWGGTALWGFSAGLVQIVIPLLVVIVGLAISSRIAEDVGNVFSVVTDNEGAQAIGGFILVFLGLFIIGAIAGFWVKMVLRFIPLFGMANRMAGMAVAVIIGFLLVSGVLTGAQKFTDDIDDDIDQSALASFMADNFDVVIRGVRLIPGDWDDKLKKITE
tara:strand:+ start:2711 stop:3220 length:510 start_codon:yes stop_codon:yes gene_type:complete